MPGDGLEGGEGCSETADPAAVSREFRRRGGRRRVRGELKVEKPHRFGSVWLARSARREETANVHPRVQDAAAAEKEGPRRRRGRLVGEEADRSGPAAGLDADGLPADAYHQLPAESRVAAEHLQSSAHHGGLQADGDGRVQSAQQPKRKRKRHATSGRAIDN